MAKTLVFGLGSAHGDDQLGWLVVDGLARAISHADIELRHGTSPSDLFDALDGVDRLFVCDACHSHEIPGIVHRWRWPDLPLASLRGAGSHNLGLGEVLTLAAQLSSLPAEVNVYTVGIASLSPATPLSSAVKVAADQLVGDLIRQLLSD